LAPFTPLELSSWKVIGESMLWQIADLVVPIDFTIGGYELV
jgi:hypothetical protein